MKMRWRCFSFIEREMLYLIGRLVA